MSWNPTRGCSRISPGCMNCYAERIAARFSGPGQPYEGLAEMTPSGPRWTGRVRLVEERLEDPLRWRKPRRIFVNSMSDLFHERLEDHDRDAIFAVMLLAQQHTFQVLTKRAGEMRAYVQDGARERIEDMLLSPGNAARRPWPRLRGAMPWPLPNVWLGVSVEDQKRADERIPLLLQTPAAVRFISAEPLLGHISLDPLRYCGGLDWVIVGGESGPEARWMHRWWVRSLRDQCFSAGVSFYFKQWGEYNEHQERVGKKAAGRDLDGRTWDEFPEVPE